MNIFKFINTAAFAALAVMIVSCTDDVKSKTDGSFSFTVKAEGPQQTKSDMDCDSESYDISMDGVKLTLTATAAPDLNDPFNSYRTKAQAVNSPDDFDSFSMNIEGFSSPATVSKSSEGKWAIVRAGNQHYQWPEVITGNGLKFDSVFGKGASISGNTVSYTMSDTDLLFARTYAKENDIPVHFYHPLAALRFKVGELTDGVSVESITLNYIYTEGSFSVPVSTSVGAMDLSSFSWDEASLTASKSVSADLYGDDEDELFVIPQAATGVTISIVFKQPSGKASQTIEVAMPSVGLSDGKWQAGYYYTYTISGGGFVEAEYTSDGSTVSVINSGSLEAYIRAAVVCNWEVEGSSVVVGAWNGSVSLADGWEQGSDGFYYYDKKVAIDAEVSFVTKFNEGDKPNSSSTPYLMKYITVQAVEADAAKVRTEWIYSPISY